jgi:hypothetical protein
MAPFVLRLSEERDFLEVLHLFDEEEEHREPLQRSGVTIRIST